MNKTKTQQILNQLWVEAPPQKQRVPYDTDLADNTPEARAARWLTQDWNYHIGGKGQDAPQSTQTAVVTESPTSHAEITTRLVLADGGPHSDPFIAHLGTLHGLKLLESVNDRLFSTYSPPGGVAMEYHVGQEYSEPVGYNHGGGFYLYLTTNTAHFMAAFWQDLIVNLNTVRGGTFSLCAVVADGPYIFYGADGRMLSASQPKRAKKAAASQLRIVSIVSTFRV